MTDEQFKQWQAYFYSDKFWKMTRAWIIKRDKGICQKCGRLVIGSKIYVHHIKEITKDNCKDANILYNQDNLITLCQTCHDKEHDRFMRNDSPFKHSKLLDDDGSFLYQKRDRLIKKLK